MTDRQTTVFSISNNSLKKMAEYLELDYSEPGNWSSPERLFRNFFKKLVEELEDPEGFSVKRVEFVDGEIRLSVDCGEAVAARAAEMLEGETGGAEEDEEEE